MEINNQHFTRGGVVSYAEIAGLAQALLKNYFFTGCERKNSSWIAKGDLYIHLAGSISIKDLQKERTFSDKEQAMMFFVAMLLEEFLPMLQIQTDALLKNDFYKN